MTDRSRISADEAISEIEEARIDTPASRAAFGDPELHGVEAIADVPFPLQAIEDPPELGDPEPEQEEATVATKFRCSFPGCVHEPFDTKQGRSRHETVVHTGGKKRAGGTRPTPRRRGRSKSTVIRARKHDDDAPRATDSPSSGSDELDRIRGILLAIRELSPTGRAFLLEQVGS